MITDKDCIFCKAWEKDLGDIYPKTDISKEFPLRRIQFHAVKKDPLFPFKYIVGTPTFIFVMDGGEVGRIEGYNDAEMFWWLVDDIMISSGLSSE